MDQLYSANGGETTFVVHSDRDVVFRTALRLMRSIQKRALRSYRDDPKNDNLKTVYESALKRSNNNRSPTLEERSEQANKVMSFLEAKLEESGGPFLFGKEYTAADAMASIWVQWIVWVKPTTIRVSPRVVEFLDQLIPAADKDVIASELSVAEKDLADAGDDDARFIAQSAIDALKSL